MKTSLIASLSFAAFLGFVTGGTVFATELVQPVQLTRSHEYRISSKAVEDDYVVRVRLPESYEKGDARYPVVYVLDADYWFGVATDIADNLPFYKETPEVIVVGIAYGKTSDEWWQKRARDFLTPSARAPVPKDIPLAGGAAKFQEFFASELIPFIESSYRTQSDNRSLVGFSYGGVFAVHTLFTRPELFQRYIIISPSLGWDKEQLFYTEAQYFARSKKLPATVFLSTGDNEGGAKTLDRWNRFRELIESRHDEGLRLTSQVFPGETHLSNYAVSYTHGLKAVFAPAEIPFRFSEATIDQLQEQMATGKLTARELTAAYLDRIAKIDKAGPKLNAVIEINPDALAIAEQLDAERKVGKLRGPLHGIPILIKDNIGTADKMETTTGSLALVGAKPLRDATIVTRLREAGAVILGKSNPSEWAFFRSDVATSGWSARGGQTRNPYVLDRDPSGSSSGSAVAVAANLCVAAVGTETDGSIVLPASIGGIVGLKPTVGLVSRFGIIPISASQDTAGPMTRNVRDAAILLRVLAGTDSRDVATLKRTADVNTEFVAALKPGALRGARLGVLHGPFGFSHQMENILNESVAKLRAAGAEVVDVGDLPSLNQLSEPEIEVLLYEFKDGINAWLTSLGPTASVKSLADLITFNENHRAQEMPFFGQELFIQAQAKGPLTEPGYLNARATCLRITQADGIDALMKKHQLVALIALTNGPAGLTDPVNGDRMTGSSSSLAAVAGYPSVTVSAAEVHGLFVGLSFIGTAWSEARLLSLAADFEAQTHARREPRFLLSIEIKPMAVDAAKP